MAGKPLMKNNFIISYYKMVYNHLDESNIVVITETPQIQNVKRNHKNEGFQTKHINMTPRCICGVFENVQIAIT